jgi:two-component system, NarL family, response regulator NreC
VLIADDHGLVRAGLRSILSSEPGMVVVGEAADGVQALELAAALQPMVVLADISMPPPDGIELARRLKTQQPDTKTLIVSMHEDPNMLADALSAGAAGYLIKRAMEHDLTRAIRAVADGRQYIHESMQDYLAQEPLLADPPPPQISPENLDERAITLLRLLANGQTLQRAAQTLGLPQPKVEQLRNELMSRLKLHNRIDIVRYVQNLKP